MSDEYLDQDVAELRAAVVGHRIVKVESADLASWRGRARLTLDDGSVVHIDSYDECCAYGELQAVIERLPFADHVITDVRADAGYEHWFIVAAAGDVLQLDVEWSEGTGYYAYGLTISVHRAG